MNNTDLNRDRLQNKTNINSISIKLGIKLGVMIGISIIFLWYIFAMYYYRYSPTRVSGLVLRRYNALNQKTTGADTAFSLKNITVGDASVSAGIAVIDNTGKVLSIDNITYELGDGTCDKVDNYCINV